MNPEEDSKPPAKRSRAEAESDTQEVVDGPNPFPVPNGPQDPEGEQYGPFTMNQHIKMLREAMRQAAIDIDADRWDNPFYRYLRVTTSVLERHTVDMLNLRAELRAMGHNLGVTMEAQHIYDGKLRAILSALIPEFYMRNTPAQDRAGVINEQYPQITPIFRSDVDYQENVGSIGRLQAQVANLQHQLDRVHTTVCRIQSDVYSGPQGIGAASLKPPESPNPTIPLCPPLPIDPTTQVSVADYPEDAFETYLPKAYEEHNPAVTATKRKNLLKIRDGVYTSSVLLEI
jgi:hypothetical protein